MLGTDAVITSSEPGTAEPVAITVTAGRAHWDPPGTVVLYAWRDCGGPAAETCCDLISFFTSRKAARRWARTRPQAGAVILSVLAENVVLTGQAACWYSWMTPPTRSRRRTRKASRSVTSAGSGLSGAALDRAI